jgi:hypothetical protein
MHGAEVVAEVKGGGGEGIRLRVGFRTLYPVPAYIEYQVSDGE